MMTEQEAKPDGHRDPAAAATERLLSEGFDRTLTCFERVVELFGDGEEQSVSRATSLLGDLLDLQVGDQSAFNAGQFPMKPGRGTGDLNSCLFLMPAMIELLDDPRDTMPHALGTRLETATRRALVATERRWDEEVFDIHRDHKAYTNIFLLYIQAFLLAGEHFEEDRLRRTAKGQWQRWFNHVAYNGIDEFVSPTYNDVDYRALQRIHNRATGEIMRRQVRLILDHLVTLQHAVTHPTLKLPICGSSRNYRRFLDGNNHEPVSVRGPENVDAGDYAPPTDVVAAYRHRGFPYEVSGRATAVPFRFRSWQLPNAALGSMSGGNYFWQQIHCMAAVGTGPENREVLFLPGSYTIAGGFVDQDENRALCLFARRPNTYHRTQALIPDAEIPGSFGDLGLGATEGWKLRADDARLEFQALDHAVIVDPFLLDGESVEVTDLNPVRRENLSQGRFHRTPVDMQEYIFPSNAQWCGCLVQLTDGEQPAPAQLTCRRQERRLTVRESGGLEVSLFLQPTGEVTELRQRDWRTMPLLDCPEQRFWPGQMAADAINQ